MFFSDQLPVRLHWNFNSGWSNSQKVRTLRKQSKLSNLNSANHKAPASAHKCGPIFVVVRFGAGLDGKSRMEDVKVWSSGSFKRSGITQLYLERTQGDDKEKRNL